MLTGNQTNDYVVIAGPSRTDPNVYRTATFLLFAATIITLVVIQLCLGRSRQKQKTCQTCRKEIITDKNYNKKISMESSSCPSTNRSEIFRKFTDPGKSETTDGEMSCEDTRPAFNSVRVDCTIEDEGDLQQRKASDDVKLRRETIQSLITDDKCFDCVPVAAVPRNHESLSVEKQRQTRSSSRGPTDIKEADSAVRRKRRSGVCLSMPCAHPLPITSDDFVLQSNEKSLNSEIKDSIRMSPAPSPHHIYGKALPQLQINGKNCDDDNSEKCYEVPSKIADDDDSTDDGQLQCMIKYNEDNCMLGVSSIYVRAMLDPGVPGFLIEVAILPKQMKSMKSKIYLTAQRDVDLIIKESFELQCNKEDFESNSLFIAVKPMFSDVVLYAETDLNSLELSNGNEILLGGNLKSLSTAAN